MATRTIGTELKLTGEKEFNQQMKAVNAGLKTTRSDMAALTSSFGDNANSMENLRKKQKLLQTSVDQHKAKVEALEKQYKAAAKQYGENSAMAQKYKQDLNNATVALNKETAALEKNADAMKKKYLAALNSVGAGSKKVFAGMGKAASGMGKMVGGASAAAAAGVVAIAAVGATALLGMVNMAKEAAEAAKAAYEAGEELTESQKKWLEYSKQLDALDDSAANAKSAIAGILLPMLSDLATEGGAYLDAFSKDMTAAAGNTEKQTQVLGKYIAEGAKLLIKKLPDYVKAGKDILGGVLKGFKGSGPELLDMGLDLIMDLLEFIIAEAPVLADAGLELVLQLLEGLDGESVADSAVLLVTKLASSLAEAAPELIPAAVRLIMELLLGLAKNAGMLLDGGWDLIVAIVEGILAGLGEIGKMGPEILDELIDSLSDDSKVIQWCSDFIDSIIDGITEVWADFVTWFNDLWDALFGGRDVNVSVNGDGRNVGGSAFHASSSGSTHGGGGGSFDGSHANGLRYVPFNGYLAELHRGEAVLTAAEAAAYRSGKGGSKIFNMTVNTSSISKEDMDMMAEYMDGKLGDDLP